MPFDIIQYDNRNENSKLGISLEFNKTKLVSSTVTTAEATISNLKTLLLTKLGERTMQPDFGTTLYEAIFEPNDDNIKDFIVESIQTAVAKWLPQVNIASIEVLTNETDPTLNNQIKIKIL